jgi:hypothetical protein
MTSKKEQFDRARAYIQLKEYSKARRILKTIDHPKAIEWLEKLDELAPERKGRGRAPILIVVAIIVLVGSFLVYRNISAANFRGDLKARLFVDCRADTMYSYEYCYQWRDLAVEVYYEEVAYCYRESERVANRDLFKECLADRGIQP